MTESREQRAMRVMSGEDRRLSASLLRGALRVGESFYSGAMTARNSLYTSGIFRSRKLPAPTISIGNLTTGGTGKTPMVRWLAEQLIARSLRPAILTRGYRAESTGGSSDEAEMLAKMLGDRAAVFEIFPLGNGADRDLVELECALDPIRQPVRGSDAPRKVDQLLRADGIARGVLHHHHSWLEALAGVLGDDRADLAAVQFNHAA